MTEQEQITALLAEPEFRSWFADTRSYARGTVHVSLPSIRIGYFSAARAKELRDWVDNILKKQEEIGAAQGTAPPDAHLSLAEDEDELLCSIPRDETDEEYLARLQRMREDYLRQKINGSAARKLQIDRLKTEAARLGFALSPKE